MSILSNHEDRINWTLIEGNWSISENNITYTILSHTRPYGIVLSSIPYTNGEISTVVRLERGKKNSGRLLFGYNIETGAYFSAGLCGHGFAYVLDEFLPGENWRLLKGIGDISTIKENAEYKISVIIDAKQIILCIDSVQVLNYVLSSPLNGKGMGLFAWGAGSVVFSGFKYDESNRPTTLLLQNPTLKRQCENKIGTNIFIGHGHSRIWKDLKDFIQDRLRLPWDEFNRIPVAGITNINRLCKMLDEAAFAFLVMTAEDEQKDGKMLARMNVVHEVGLFQGRLGFKKAIILLEDGCEEFSNIYGLGQVRFPKDNIGSVFEEIRLVLEREGLLEQETKPRQSEDH